MLRSVVMTLVRIIERLRAISSAAGTPLAATSAMTIPNQFGPLGNSKKS